ncbi:MAG: DUF5615 family PIN-like protein [Planctomycetaceae bacterium]|nr:DUF5615 family PIN-like protein [Planctomycetales bacterium]MCB9940354.1 DUF5615 family PIN-like protein [Planctomycetaceae bacterium]
MAHDFYMDVHVPSAITEGLRRRGIDVLTSQDDGTRQLNDEVLLVRATALERILFTQDEDLLAIASAWQHQGRVFAGLAYCHQLGAGIGEIVEDLELIATCANDEEVRSQVVFLPLR